MRLNLPAAPIVIHGKSDSGDLLHWELWPVRVVLRPALRSGQAGILFAAGGDSLLYCELGILVLGPLI